MLISEKLSQVLRDCENFLEIPHRCNVFSTENIACDTSPCHRYIPFPGRYSFPIRPTSKNESACFVTNSIKKLSTL